MFLIRTMRGPPIYVSRLSLVNFRNYERLALDLEPGMVLLHGGNGQGKSNLLEALYLLAIAKSPRASADRELMRRQSSEEDAHAQVSATVEREPGRARVQIDFQSVSASSQGATGPAEPERASVQKYVRVNGAPRRASDLVGEINAVMFSAQDLQIVLGSPSVRRRYLDILISQLDRHYLRALQRYGRVVTQRNHMLRSMRGGRSRPEELDFWDDELVAAGASIMARRVETVRTLSQIAGPAHRDLSGGGEDLMIAYRPSVEVEEGASEADMAASLRSAMEAMRDRELAQGVTVRGPHRDDLQMLVDRLDAAMYASRGQCRTVVLAMKLAEAAHLREERGQEPVLLLDDVLSELDASRRSQVLETVSAYQQCFITTTDVEPIEERYRSRMCRFEVRGGRVEAVSGT